jgi:hypothetical protein
LTVSANAEHVEGSARDGTFVVFRRLLDRANLHRLDLQSLEESQLTAESVEDFSPMLSEDTARVAFERRNPGRDLRHHHAELQILLAHRHTSGLGDPSVLAEDGYAPSLSPDGRWLTYLTNPPHPETGSGIARFPELRLLDLETRQSKRVTPRFQGYGFHLFPREWITFNRAWSKDARFVYFTQFSESSGSEIHRLRLGGEETKTEPVELRAGPGVRLNDLMLSEDGLLLAWVENSGDDTLRNARVHVRDLVTGTGRVVLEERLKSPEERLLRGWMDGHTLIYLGARANSDLTWHMEIFELATTGSRRLAGVRERTVLGTARFDPVSKTVYVTGVDRGIHNVFAFSMIDRGWRRLTDNEIPGVSFSGIDVSIPGSLVYSRQEKNQDLWVLRLGSD